MHLAISVFLDARSSPTKSATPRWRMDKENPLIIPLKPSRLPTTCCSIQN